ncbi:kinase-like domain-containing protein [Mycena galericulata]|nr:kinase-like domain-containing protein [Mycena galericulata]
MTSKAPPTLPSLDSPLSVDAAVRESSDECEPLVATQPVEDDGEPLAATQPVEDSGTMIAVGSFLESEVSWEEVLINSELAPGPEDEVLVATQPTNEPHPIPDLGSKDFLLITYLSDFNSGRLNHILRTLAVLKEAETPPPDARNSPIWSLKSSDQVCQHYDCSKPRFLGQGATSLVFSITVKDSQKEVALKRMRFPGGLPEVPQEIANLEKLKGFSGVNQIIEVFEDRECNILDIVLELEFGGDLYKRVLYSDDLGEESCKHIARQICTVLAELHQQGIAHRDVKPHNILLNDKSEMPTVKIADFGNAKQTLTTMQTLCGTDAFMAPEIGAGPYDIAVDAWSYGITVSFLLLAEKFSPILEDIERHRSNHSLIPKILSCLEEKNISLHGQDFIRELLQMDPKVRMSCEQALKHPWLISEPVDASCGVRSGTLIEHTNSLSLVDLPSVTPTTTLKRSSETLEEHQNQDCTCDHFSDARRNAKRAFDSDVLESTSRKKSRVEVEHEWDETSLLSTPSSPNDLCEVSEKEEDPKEENS